MRRPRLSFARSKSTLLLLFVAAGISFGVSSCSKDDDTKNSSVSQEQVASVVTQSVVSQGGVVAQVDQATLAVSLLEARKAGGRLSDFCGKSNEDNISGSGEANGLKFSYDLGWSYALACTQDVPTEFSFNFNGKTSFETDKFSTKDSSIATYKLGGLGETSVNWVLNQTFDRAGSLISKTADIPSFNSTIHYVAADIKVSKETRQIVSGTATVKVTGVDLKGNAFKYEGTITFKGNQKAVFVVNGGSNFELQW